MLSVGSCAVIGSGACTVAASAKGWPSAIQMRVAIGPSGRGFIEYKCQPGCTAASSLTLKRAPVFTGLAGGLSIFQATGSGGAAKSTPAAIAAHKPVLI